MLFKEKQRMSLQSGDRFRLALTFPAEAETLSGKSNGSGPKKVLTAQGSWVGDAEIQLCATCSQGPLLGRDV